MKCSICSNDIEVKRSETGEVIWDQGNNAEPVNDGRCCDVCNWTVVIPRRIAGVKIIKKTAKLEETADEVQEGGQE